MKEEMMKRAETINQLLEGKGYGFHIKYESVLKNNGRRDSYQFYGQGYNVLPVLYFDESWWNMSDSALADYLNSIFKEKSFHLDEKPFFSREYILSHVLPKIVSQNNSHEFLKEHIVCAPFLDMVVTFYLPIKEQMDGMLSVKITEEFLQAVTFDELKNAAITNIEKTYRIETLESMLAEMGESSTFSEDPYPMYVLTNDSKINGASAVISKKIMRELSERLGTEDIIMLPSSIHEFIAIPASEALEFPFLLELVKNANENIVNPQDKLTDSIYIWKSGKFLVLH